MRLFIHHRSEYRFSEPQARVVQLLRFTPVSHAGQNVIDWRIDVDCNARLRPGRDGFGNEVSMLYIDGPVEALALAVRGEVLTEDRGGAVSGVTETLPPIAYFQETPLTAPHDRIAALAASVRGRSARDRAHALNAVVHHCMTFDRGRRAEPCLAAEALAEGRGYAQDFAHVYIAAARLLGLPARYVSGHVFREDEPDHWTEAAHGWVEAYLGDEGWTGFDPTAGRSPDAAYVRVAIGQDYRGAAPISGTRIGGGLEELDVAVRVGLSQRQDQA
jgi:transglutaminase-like putative cysteine protease